MPWPYCLLIGAALLLLLGFLLLPVRIFACYLRENNNVKFNATIKAGPLVYRIRKLPDLGRSPIRPRQGGVQLLRKLARLRPLMQQISWIRFMLELSFGMGDPALTGFLTGIGWSVGSCLLASVQRLRRCMITPTLTIVPVFARSYLRVHWEGEFSLPVYGWLRLMLAMIKAEVLTFGKPPH